MAAELFQSKKISAIFKGGKTPIGHHWKLVDEDEQPLGYTKRLFSGGLIKRFLWRTVTLTGMDKGNAIRAQIFDSQNRLVASLVTKKGKQDKGQQTEPHSLELSNASGQVIGYAKRTWDQGIEYQTPDGKVFAKIATGENDGDDPWQFTDSQGEALGRLTRQKAKYIKPVGFIDRELFDMYHTTAHDYQQTQHLGFAFSRTYSVALTDIPMLDPLRTFAVLTPAITAYLY